jgi:hypothetical protein
VLGDPVELREHGVEDLDRPLQGQLRRRRREVDDVGGLLVTAAKWSAIMSSPA